MAYSVYFFRAEKYTTELLVTDWFALICSGLPLDLRHGKQFCNPLIRCTYGKDYFQACCFYIRRDKLNKRGEAPVFMRLTINGERADASIKRFIEPHAWNSDKGKANEKMPWRKGFESLSERHFRQHFTNPRDLELDKKEVSAQIILNRYLGQGAVGPSHVNGGLPRPQRKCRALIGINFAPDTVLRYETCLRLIEEFMRNTYKKEDCYLKRLPNNLSRNLSFISKQSANVVIIRRQNILLILRRLPE